MLNKCFKYNPFPLFWQILIEFCAGGAVDAIMLGESACLLCIQAATSRGKLLRKQREINLKGQFQQISLLPGDLDSVSVQVQNKCIQVYAMSHAVILCSLV